jgi:hypothetical protein
MLHFSGSLYFGYDCHIKMSDLIRIGSVLLTNTWSTFLEKLTVTHLVKKFHIFYAIGIRVWEVDVETSSSTLSQT